MRRISVIQLSAPLTLAKRRLALSLYASALALCTSACGIALPRSPSPARALEAARLRPFVPASAYEAYLRGELALAQGDARRASQQFELATTAPDEDAYLLTRLAEAQRQSGDRTLAETTLLEAERVEPCAESVWLTRGAWAEQDQKLAQAQAAYEKALTCTARGERAVLALARVYRELGQVERSLDLLGDAARTPTGPGAKAAFARALSAASVAEVRFALDGWLSFEALDSVTLTEAVTRAVSRHEPTLALSLLELPSPGLASPERARLLLSAQDRPSLRALLATHHESELGGADAAARFALVAGDFERAELYASIALGREPNDDRYRLRARARARLGEEAAALEDLRAVQDRTLQIALAREQLRRLGFDSLVSELEAPR